MIDRDSRPNLVVIGAMKCGTTSLHYYLKQHPQISMSTPKELNFFQLDQNWNRGVEWYRDQFPGDALVHGESSPGYSRSIVSSGVPERMFQVVPHARLIYMVRDPIERLISHYVHKVWDGGEERPAEEALRPSPDNPYLSRSRYFTELGHYLPLYPLERILVLDSSELGSNRRAAMRRVFEFLEVDPDFSSWRMVRRLHRSRQKRSKTPLGRRIAETAPFRGLSRLPGDLRLAAERAVLYPFSRSIPRPRLNPELRRQLQAALKEDIDRFRDLTNQDFRGWSV